MMKQVKYRTTKLFFRAATTVIMLVGLIYTNATTAQILSNAHVGLVYPISTNGVHAKEYSNKFSLHVLAGVSGGERGLCLSGISSYIVGNSSGVQIAGISNHILAADHGLALAGILNQVKTEITGLQLAGVVNLAGSVDGLQLAGFTNLTKGNVTGIQVAGFFNAAKDADVQVAGFINTAKDVKGPQVAGFVNVAKEVRGAQIAGFINVAKKVKGVQIAGFLNIADSSDYPIALINIIKNGERSVAITTDEALTTIASYRSGGKRLYGILGVGYNLKNDAPLYALEGGLGMHIPVSENFRINTEVALQSLSDFKAGYYFKSSLRVLPTLKFGPVEIFAGPSFNVVTIGENKGRTLVTDYLWSRNHYGYFNGIYIGVTGGVQFHF